MAISEMIARFVGQWSIESDPTEYAKQALCNERELCQILLADQHLCWKRNAPRPIDYYLRAWPDSRANSDLLLRFLTDEFGYREESGRGESIEQFVAKISNVDTEILSQLVQQLREDEEIGSSIQSHRASETTPRTLDSVQANAFDTTRKEPQVRKQLGRRHGSTEPPSFPNFEVFEEIGSGAFGIVYRARDVQLDREVAIKILKPEHAGRKESSDRFIQEAKKAARTDCRGIVPVYQVGRSPDGSLFLVSRLVSGGDLRQWLRGEEVREEEAARVISGCARALAVAHRIGLVHRDIKPANVLLDDESQPWITDFGLALFDDELLVHRGEVAGTPVYMSPEQISGKNQFLDGRADIWSLGALLYELLTGRQPFLGKRFSDLSEGIRQRSPKPLRMIRPGVSPSLEHICVRCLQKRPEHRYQTGLDLAEALDAFLHSQRDADAVPHRLVFQVQGTPYLYVPPANRNRFMLGRQKRKGVDDRGGCEFVIRCVESKRDSLRISRRHLEVHFSDDEAFVTDQSTVGTRLNGQRLSKGIRARIAPGDELQIADVVTLNVLSRAATVSGSSVSQARVSLPDDAHEQYVIEVSTGDLTTWLPTHATESPD